MSSVVFYLNLHVHIVIVCNVSMFKRSEDSLLNTSNIYIYVIIYITYIVCVGSGYKSHFVHGEERTVCVCLSSPSTVTVLVMALESPCLAALHTEPSYSS